MAGRIARTITEHWPEDWRGGAMEFEMELERALDNYDLGQDPVGAASIWAREVDARERLPCLAPVRHRPVRLVFLMGLHSADAHGGRVFWLPERAIESALASERITKRMVNSATVELRRRGLIEKIGQEQWGVRAAEYELFAAPSDILAGAVPEPLGDCSGTENGELVGCGAGGGEDEGGGGPF